MFGLKFICIIVGDFEWISIVKREEMRLRSHWSSVKRRGNLTRRWRR